MSGRRLFLLLLLVGAALVPLLAAAFGPARTFSLWNIPVMRPAFADARAVTAGAESWRTGHDPLVANPADPWHRVLNYPRVWQFAARLGLAQRHTTAIALVMIAAFVAGLALFVRDVDRRSAWLLAAALFSPAVMLGIERANVCLLIFFLCAAALQLLRRSPPAAAVMLTAAGLLKYYPFLGLVCLARAPRRDFLCLAGGAALVGAAYLALTWRDVWLVLRGIDRGTFLSYGVSVGWMAAREAGASRAVVLAVAAASALLLAGVVVVAVRAWRQGAGAPRAGAAAPSPAIAAHLDGFRLGAAIYVGTFLLGNNWDYRLMFTLFCVPQLADWSLAGAADPADGALRTAARVTLAALLASLWLQFFFRFARFAPGGGYAMLAVDELTNWALLGGLAYMLAGGMPRWGAAAWPRALAPAQARSRGLARPGPRSGRPAGRRRAG